MGQTVCKDHEQTALGKESSRQVAKLEREVRTLLRARDGEERQEAARRFRQRIERGEFAVLFAGKFGELLRELGSKEGMVDEIGALRMAAIRLMLEEEDPAKMATALSKVVHATATAIRTQQTHFPKPHPTVREIEQAWEELGRMGAPAAQRRVQGGPGGCDPEPGAIKALPEGPKRKGEVNDPSKNFTNEAERLFWEADDPWAYHEYLRGEWEKEQGEG
jgi:hypothetical protein